MATSKIFFSYSRVDSGFALQLAKDIRSSGIDIWIDQLDIQAGNHWDAAVEKALATSACVLVILTPSSTSSTNVMDEVSYALESGKKIIPVLLEDCLPPFRLRRLQRIDFTKDYNNGLTQLLAAIEVPVAESVAKSESEEVRTEIPVVAPDPQKKIKDDAELESRLWDAAAKQNSIAGYEKYLKDTVTGEYTAEAKLLIHQLTLEQQEDERETGFWKKSKAENTLQAYRDYLKAYPDRNYKSLAMAAIAEIEQAQKEEQKRQEERRKEEHKRQEERRNEEQRLADEKKEPQRQEAKRQAEKREAEKREEARKLEEKRKEEKKIEEQKKAEKRQEEQRQEEIRKEQKRQEALQKEKEKEEKKKLAAQQAAASGKPVPQEGASGKKILVFGSVIAVIGLIVWLIVGMNGAGKRDDDAWVEATQSASYEAYMAQFPKGKHFSQAQQRIDSLKARNQVMQDSLAAVAVATAEQARKDSIAASKTATKPTTATPEKTTAKPTTKPVTSTPTKPTSQYKLGQAFGGGIVAFIDHTGAHGLIAAEKDLGNFSFESAAKKKSKFSAGGFTDWRIPTKDELARIYGLKKELGLIPKGTYWSSTPDKSKSYWAMNMIDGKMAIVSEDLSFYVRLVRNF